MTNTTQFTNNATSTLAAALTTSATSFAVAPGAGSLFPTLTTGQTFYATLAAVTTTAIEIVSVTARSTDTFTIVRAQGGTTATAFASGDKVELRITAASAANWEAKAAAGANADITSMSACAALTNVSTINGSAYPPASAGVRLMTNRIINGAMLFDQRNNGASTTPAANTYVADRFKFAATAASKFTTQQLTGVFGLFANSLTANSTSGYAPAASDYFTLSQTIEGTNVSDLSWGTAGAKAVTLSFTAASSIVGTFGGSVQNSGSTRSYPFSYTITAANTATPVSVTIPGDTAGTWLTSVGGAGVQVNFSLGAGATYQGAANTWAGANYTTVPSAVNVVSTSGAAFQITGVQFEVGSAASLFERRSYTQEFLLCQRYCYNWTGAGGVGAVYPISSGGNPRLGTAFPVSMATSPSYGAVQTNFGFRDSNDNSATANSFVTDNISSTGITGYFNNLVTGSLTDNLACMVSIPGSLIFSAEF